MGLIVNIIAGEYGFSDRFRLSSVTIIVEPDYNNHVGMLTELPRRSFGIVRQYVPEEQERHDEQR